MNHAKCKLCGSVIESIAFADIVECSCGEIAIWGGKSALYSSAKDYANFLRIDENGRELPVKYRDKKEDGDIEDKAGSKPEANVAEDHLLSLVAFMDSIERLPESAKNAPASNRDLAHLCALVIPLFIQTLDVRR